MSEEKFVINSTEDSEFNDDSNLNQLSIVPFKKKEVESKGFLKILFTDKEEIIQADSFGPYEPFPGFIIFFRDNPEEVVGIHNSAFIKSIEILKDQPSN